MAFVSLLNKCNRLTVIICSKRILRYFSSKSISFELDALDAFTNQLVQRKSCKWEMLKQQRIVMKDTFFNLEHCTAAPLNEENTSIDELNVLFKTALEEFDHKQIMSLVSYCFKFKVCPSLSVFTQVLSIFSQNGDKEAIVKLQQLTKEVQPDSTKANSNFEHYLAEATWIRGDVSKALILYEEVYRNNVFLRRQIRLMLKYLIVDTIANRSEAALVNLTDFCERLSREYRDFFPLACVWQMCFLSSWYTDNCLALELLEKNNELCKAVLNRISFVVTNALKLHQTESVYRLLEVLLKLNLKQQYSVVLSELFNYRCRSGTVILLLYLKFCFSSTG